jgi:hypothetical protein
MTMTLLGDIGSIAKAITDPGAIAQEAIGNFLPKEISGVLGNVVAGVVDLSTGNGPQALQHTLMSLADLPQLAHSAGSTSNLTCGGSANFEPNLPPGGAGNMAASSSWRNTTNLQQLLQQIVQSLRGNTGNVTININTTPGQAPGTTGAGSSATPATNGTSPASSSAAATTSPSGTTGWSGPTGSWGTSGSSATSSGPSSSDATISSSGATGSPGTSAPTGTMDDKGKFTAAGLDKLSNTDFMNAISDGKISDTVSKDPAAMRAIQARMDQISEMNQLMTSMMQAMHQMEMSIIQNIRV